VRVELKLCRLSIRFLSKPSELLFGEGGSARRSGVYRAVHEHSSTEPTQIKHSSEGFAGSLSSSELSIGLSCFL
jgi:hypothetical protein